jgi:hypothetical protein
MPTFRHSSDVRVFPRPVAAYVAATNAFDLDRLLATFADDALVNDQLRDYWGKTAIREWAERDIIGERLTINVVGVMSTTETSSSLQISTAILTSEDCQNRYCLPSTSPRTMTRSSS